MKTNLPFAYTAGQFPCHIKPEREHNHEDDKEREDLELENRRQVFILDNNKYTLEEKDDE